MKATENHIPKSGDFVCFFTIKLCKTARTHTECTLVALVVKIQT